MIAWVASPQSGTCEPVDSSSDFCLTSWFDVYHGCVPLKQSHRRAIQSHTVSVRLVGSRGCWIVGPAVPAVPAGRPCWQNVTTMQREREMGHCKKRKGNDMHCHYIQLPYFGVDCSVKGVAQIWFQVQQMVGLHV